jgi:hypothetical protein
MGKSGVQNYLNTIIFCIVAKTITVFILAFLVNEKVRWFSFFLLTIEVGLIVVIITSLITIARYDKRMGKMANDLRTSVLTNIDCPDYYVRGISPTSSNVECRDGFTTPDNRFTYSFTNSNIFPDRTDRYASIRTIDLDANFNNKSFTTACDTLTGSNVGYSNISWTDLRSKCEWV